MSNKKNESASSVDKSTVGSKCSNCGKSEVYSKGLCEQCYKSEWYLKKRATKPKSTRKPGRPTLTGEKPTECTSCGAKPIYARGLCYKCYKRAYQRGDVTEEAINASYKKPRTVDPETGEKKTCSYCGLNPVYSKDLCRKCFTRAKRNGGDPTYKGRSYERIMRSERMLKEKREREKSEESKKNE